MANLNSQDLFKLNITGASTYHFDSGRSQDFGVNIFSDLAKPPLNDSFHHGGDPTLDYQLQPGTYWLAVNFTGLTDAEDLSYSLSIRQQ